MELVEYLYYRERVEAFDPKVFGRVGRRRPPETAEDFSRAAAYVVLASGISWTVVRRIWERVEPLVVRGKPLGESFANRRKKAAIDDIVSSRETLYGGFRTAWSEGPDAVIAFCETLPGIGPVTKYHLAKNLGVDCAKPDIWLERVAAAAGEDTHTLCRRLSTVSGDPVALVDYVIWRACERGWWESADARS